MQSLLTDSLLFESSDRYYLKFLPPPQIYLSSDLCVSYAAKNHSIEFSSQIDW